MGRPQLPDGVKKDKGTYRKDRANGDAPKPALVLHAEAPEYLSDYAKKAWESIIPELIRVRIFTELDVVVAGTMCEELGRYWELMELTRKKLYKIVQNKIVVDHDMYKLEKMAKEHLVAFEKMAGKFGMNPSDRQRLIVKEAPKDGPVDPMAAL